MAGEQEGNGSADATRDLTREASPRDEAHLLGYAPQLDGLRAFAVIFVVLFHTAGSGFAGGYVGVDVFFVLSGFLITGILLRESSRTGTISLGRFYMRRALRLLPALVFLALVLGVAYLVLLGPEERTDGLFALGAALLYVTSPLAAGGADLGSMLHAWSLSVEEYFYIGWPVVLLIVIRRLGRSRVYLGIGFIAIAAVAYRLITAVAGWPLERIYYAADTRAEQLLIGCLLAALVSERRFRVPAWIGVIGAIAMVTFVLLPSDLTGAFYRFGGSTVLALASAAVIACLVTSRQHWASRVLSSSPLVWIGRRSYGIYLWHAPIAAMAVRFLPAWIPLVIADIVLTLVVAALSYRFVEQRFLKMKTRFAPRARPLGRNAA